MDNPFWLPVAGPLPLGRAQPLPILGACCRSEKPRCEAFPQVRSGFPFSVLNAGLGQPAVHVASRILPDLHLENVFTYSDSPGHTGGFNDITDHKIPHS